jgi:mono/diheme cytochrome c family protein
MRHFHFPAAVLLLLVATGGASAEPTPNAVRAFLTAHCRECHTGAKPKGGFDLEKLTPDFADKANRDRWWNVLEQLKAGAMPPKGKPRPPAKDAKAVTEWVAAQADAVDAANAARRAANGRAVLRRLNRIEYENTLRDLLGIEVELQEMLPADSSASGFDTSGDAHHTSSFLMEKYLEAADIALGKAIANNAQPPLVKNRYTLKEERAVKVSTESVFLPRDDELVMFSSSGWNTITVGQFYPPDRGKYRIRISASGYQSGGKPVVYRVDAGPMLMGTKNHLVSYFDAAPNKQTVVEFVDHFEARNHIRISPYGLANAQTVTKVGAEKYEGPGLAVQWVEVEGPLFDTWPPESHRRIFGDLERTPAPVFNNSTRVEVVSKNPEADAEKILRDFARRAFRRNVTDGDVKPFLDLVKAKLAAKQSFEKAMRVGLTAILVSPDFLFLREKPGKLDDFAVASRLSYLFWSTMPDEELLALAEKGKLSQPEVLRAQVERMLKHPKAVAFTENFVGQWLGLREIDFTEPSFLLYPEYDAMLRVSMVKETELFFAEVLKNDLSLTNFVASDFSMLNGRLAKHYGIAGVDGYEFRKVKLPAESHRGGLLTMASVLKVTANGTTTSPVVRGAWVLDRILGTQPPKPPADVPAIEPDIRGSTTIREQLAKHRQVATCAACHAKIDPPGFALESFDVIGGWRDNYRTTGNGKPVVVDGRRMPYHEGKKVDPSDVFGEEKFANIDEFKQLLLKDKDQLARALTEKLLTYATGSPPTAADKPEIEAILRKVREKDYGLRTLVHEIVQSRLFQNK